MVEMLYTVTSGVHAAGIPVGIVMMETHVPYPPGSPLNARTFDFPVTYEVVSGATMDTLIYAPQFDALRERFIQAGRALVAKGVRAVVGGCGFMVLFQNELAEALPVPVYASSLVQLPLIAQSIPRARSVGILTASRPSLSARHMEIACAGVPVRYVVRGLEDRPAFKSTVHDQSGTLDFDAVQADVVAEALAMKQDNPDVAAILLECTDLPPYADAVAEATGLPVYDITTLINWVYRAVEPKRYPHVRN
jgi:Asp/Glu/hydantoin racemase